MKRFLLTIAIISFLTSVIEAADLKSDLKLMLSWFEGRFDNFAQTVEEKESGAEFPHEHIHSIFARVDLPQIGENVFYVQQYMDGDPTKLYRQRIYTFFADKKEKAIVLKIYTLPDEKAVIDAHLDKSKLQNLTLKDLYSPPGCEVYWRRNGERFEGTMKKNACRVVSKRSGKTLIITDDLILTKDEIWIRDQATDEQGNYVFGNKANIHHKLKRVRMFEGWTAIAKDGSTEMLTADLPADKYDAKRNLITYDQGGFLKLNDKFTARLAQMTHRSGIKVMTLSIIDNATQKIVAYTWTNPDAERIGINLRWVQVGLTLKK